MGANAQPAREGPDQLLPSGCVLENRFIICKLLGIGGMGEVYEAEDLRLNRAPIALKTIRSDSVAHGHVRARFQREVLLARSIAHPNVCPVYEFFTTWAARGEIWFLTMKLLSGETLAVRLKRLGPVPKDDALRLAREIGSALEAAHNTGIVHRDLKPGNIFLEDHHGATRAVITDFGLAQVWSQELESLDASAVVGTPRYIAPELALGRSATPASDVYSFGVVLEDLLFGSAAATAPHTSAETKALPSDRFSRGAMQVIRRCKELQPERRFPTAPHVVEALEQAARDTPALTTRRTMLGGTAAAVAAAAGAGWLSRDSIEKLLHPVPRPRRVAVLPGQAVPAENASLLSAVLETVSNRLANAEPLARDLFVVPAQYLRQQHVVDGRQAAGLFGVNLVLGASLEQQAKSLRIVLALTHAVGGAIVRQTAIACPAIKPYLLPNLAVNAAASLLDISRAGVDASSSTGDTSNAEAYAAYERARDLLYQHGLPNTDRAIAELQNALKLDARYANAWAALGQAYVIRYGLSRDGEALNLAERNVRKALQLAPELPAAYTAGAAIKLSRGDYEHAVQDLETAMKLDPDSVDLQLTLAHAYARWGKLDLADRTYQRVLDERPNNWTTLNDWGSTYFRRANYSRAEALFRQATIAAPQAALPWRNLGAVCLVTDQFEDAQRALDRSISLLPSGEAYTNRGTALFWLGRYRDAARAYRAAVDLNPQRDELWRNLGDAYQMIPGMNGEATAAWQRAATLARKALEVNPTDRDTLTLLALCEAKLGNRQAAFQALNRASSPTAPEAGQLFNEALAYEVAGEREVAIKLLAQCMGRGYSRFEINHAPELEALRKDARFKKLAASATG